VQRIRVPALVTPDAPSGEQKAPAWTTSDAGSGGVVRFGDAVGPGGVVGRGGVVGLRVVVVVGAGALLRSRAVVVLACGFTGAFVTALTVALVDGPGFVDAVAPVGCVAGGRLPRPCAIPAADDVEVAVPAPHALTAATTASSRAGAG
jgi:hypothetical protein